MPASRCRSRPVRTGIPPVSPCSSIGPKLCASAASSRRLEQASEPPSFSPNENRAAAPRSAARLTILHCALHVPKQRDTVKKYFAYLVSLCSQTGFCLPDLFFSSHPFGLLGLIGESHPRGLRPAATLAHMVERRRLGVGIRLCSARAEERQVSVDRQVTRRRPNSRSRRWPQSLRPPT